MSLPLDPGKPVKPLPLSGWATAEQNRLNAKQKLAFNLDQQTTPGGPLGGFEPLSPEQLKGVRKARETEYQRASQTAEKERLNSLGVVEEIAKDLLNTDVFPTLITQDADGRKTINDGALTERLWGAVQSRGGSEMLVNMIAPQVKARAVAALNAPAVEAEAQKEFAKFGQKRDELNTKIIDGVSLIKAKGKSAIKVISADLKRDLDGGFEKLKKEYQPVADEINQRYGFVKTQLQNELTSDIISQSQFDIDQRAAELEQEVSKGMNPEVAQANMNLFLQQVRKRNEQLLGGEEFKARVQTEFEQRYGELYQSEIGQINEEFSSKYNQFSREAKGKAQDKFNYIKSVIDDFYGQMESISKDFDKDSLAVIQNTYSKAWDKVMADQESGGKKLTEALYAISMNPGMGMGAGLFGRFLGESAAYNVGNMSKGLGYALNSMGFEGEFTRWLKDAGGELTSENFRYKPDLKAWHMLSPAFMGDAVGQLAYSAPTLAFGAGLSAVTGGGSLAIAGTALFGAATDASNEMGNAYEQHLAANPYDIEGANKVAQKVFLGNMVLTPLHAAMAKFWIGGSKGVKSLLKMSAAEAVQESAQSGLSQAALKPVTGNYALDALKYSFTKEAIHEGILAGYSSLLTGGAALSSNRIRSAISSKVNGAAQYFANNILTNGGKYTRGLLAYEGYTEEQRTMALATIDRVEAAVNDAQAAGLDRAKTLFYVELTERVQAEKAKLENIQNPTLREKQESLIKKLEDGIGKLVEGTAKVTVVNTPAGSVALEEGEAQKLLSSPAMQDGVKEGFITVETDNKDIQGLVDTAKASVTAEEAVENPVAEVVASNLDDIDTNTTGGKKVVELMDQGAPMEQVTEVVLMDVVQDPTAASQTYGPDVVSAVRAEVAKQLREAMVAEAQPATVQAAPETQVESGESAMEVPGKLDEMTGQVPTVTPESTQLIPETVPTTEVPTAGTKMVAPAITMNYMSNEEIVKSPDAVKVKRAQAKITKEMKQLESVLSCLTK
jgi:hypothetical protein